MSKIKNYQKLDKNSIFSNCSYAQSAGVYYNQEGFSNVTNKIQDMGTYNPDKYILGNITKPNKKTFVNYDKHEIINKGNNTKININNIKNNKETYAYVSGIIVPTIEAEVKPITEILKETENNITNSKNIVINSKEFKELHKEEKVINNKDIKQVKSKSSVNLFSKVFENKQQNDINDINDDNVIYLNGWVWLNRFNKPYAHNFGDDINFSFLKELTGKQHKKYNKKDKKINYSFIGSILFDEWIDDFTEIWGSGFLYKHNLKNKPHKIYAVRGPKTRDQLLDLNIDCPETYGDPALLIPYYYYPYVMKKYKLGIIPHHSHIKSDILNKFKDNKDILIIDFTKYNDWKDIIKEIVECEFIVSESLHGLIISEAYRIPNIWISIGKNIGQNFKFEDFFLSIHKPLYDSYLVTEETTEDDLFKLKDNYDSTFDIDLQKLVDVCPVKLNHLNLYNKPKKYTGKVLLCCIGKMENKYIREFVEHNKSIGFDNIVLYDNNDIDGEHFDDVIGDYITSGYVILKDWRGKELAQIPSYTDCYNTYKDEYDWIAYFDIDEFLELDCNDIHKFLSNDMFNDRGINTIRVCWRQYTDSGLIKVEDNNYSMKRFTEYLPITRNWSTTTKIIFKTCIDNIEFNSPHGILYDSPYSKKIVTVNAIGQLCRNSMELRDNEKTWNKARINHYRFKTIEEYVMNKMVRRWPTDYLNSGKNGLNINFFFKFNKKTDEKVNYANYLLDKYNISRNE